MLSHLVDANLLTKSNLVKIFSELSKEGRFSKNVLKNVLFRMINQKKLTQAQAKTLLADLATGKVIKEQDTKDILLYLKNA